jgi:cytidine deaminase
MLTNDDHELIGAARDVIRRRYRKEWQGVGAALRTRSGHIYTGVHLETNVGRVAVCAEAIALGRAITEEGATGIETIVAVIHPERSSPDQSLRVVAPCGMCRELISDYDSNARVIVPDENGVTVVPIGDLLPNKFV